MTWTLLKMKDFYYCVDCYPICLVLLTGGKKPQDRTIVERVLRVISTSLLIVMYLLASVGILASACLLAFNCVHRHRRYNQWRIQGGGKYNRIQYNTLECNTIQYNTT